MLHWGGRSELGGTIVDLLAAAAEGQWQHGREWSIQCTANQEEMMSQDPQSGADVDTDDG